MNDIEFTVFINFHEESEDGAIFQVRLIGVTEDYGFESDYIQKEAIAEIARSTKDRFVIPVMIFPGYNPKFEGMALYELDSYSPSNEKDVRGVITYRFTGTAA